MSDVKAETRKTVAHQKNRDYTKTSKIIEDENMINVLEIIELRSVIKKCSSYFLHLS